MEILVYLFILFCGVIVGGIISTILLLRVSSQIIDKKNARADKFEAYFYLYDKWVDLKERDIQIERYFIERDYHKIAIYGMGKVGRHFLNEMKGTEIEVLYAIDGKENLKNQFIPIYSLKKDLKEVDVVVVTPVFDYDRIYQAIKEVANFQIVSLDDILYELS